MKKDWVLFIAIAIILLFGLSTLYSTVIDSETVFGGGIFNRQLLFELVSLLVYFGFAYFDYRFLGNSIVIIPSIVTVFILLSYVLFFGDEINNARRWIILGGIQIQPSEFAKLTLLIASAWILSLRRKYQLWKLIIFVSALALLFSLLVFFEPDAGTTLVTLAIWVLLVFTVLPNKIMYLTSVSIALIAAVSVIQFILTHYAEGTLWGTIAILLSAGLMLIAKKMKLLVPLALIFGIVIGMGSMYAWNSVLHEYQKNRIETFINPGGKGLNEGFQVEQSKVAIGSGQIWGKGYGLGTQSKLRFLPEHQTDFVFATYAEEFGTIGAVSLIVLYAIVIYRIFRASLLVENSFGSLLCLVIGIKLLIEVFINIGMNMGLVPATGVPLPLMSSGGSMLLVTMTGLGLVQSTLIHRDEEIGV